MAGEAFFMDKGYRCTTPPSRWEEAALCGNGTIGAIAMCGTKQETVVFSHEKLFLPQNPKLPPVDTGSHLTELRAMLAAGEYARAGTALVELSRAEGYSGMRWTDSFMPAGDLHILLDCTEPVTDYRRGLDFTSGLAEVAWTAGHKAMRREMFVSRADGIAVIRTSAGNGGKLSGNVDLGRHPPDDMARWLRGQERHLERFDQVEHSASIVENGTGDAGSMVLYCTFRDTAFGYACTARVLAPGGRISVQGGRIFFEDAQEVLVLMSIDYFPDTSVVAREMDKPPPDGLSPDFDMLLARHAAIHTAMFDRLDFQLACNAPCDAQYTRLFHAGRYHILSSAGKTPPNLQGIWTGTYTVPWSSDYTQNGNTQTAILALLPGNMADVLPGYFDYQESLLPDYRENARRLYRCRGIHLPSRTSNHGLNNHFNESWTHTFWTAGAGWAAHFYYDYWLYTGDRTFFLERALPFMMEAALFYEDFLIEDGQGHWLFSPSYSPENNPAGSTAQACVNATMDIAVARELFGNLIEGCVTLGIEAGRIAGWRRMLEKMPPYRINSDGALQEWCHDGLEDRYDHRHASHLYPLYYGVAREIRESPQLYAACAQAYRLRLKERRKELGVMGFGLIQLGFAAAHLGDAATVEVLLRTLANGYYYINFASSHNAGPDIFNVDISGGVPALMMETVLQSCTLQKADGGIGRFELHLLPCLPAGWREGRLRGVRARGGFELDITWAEGRLVRAEVANPLENRCDILWNGLVLHPERFDRRTFVPVDFT